MPGKTRRYRGWLLIETVKGWFIEKGGERKRVGYSYEELTDDLYDRYRKAVDDIEDNLGGTCDGCFMRCLPKSTGRYPCDEDVREFAREHRFDPPGYVFEDA